MHDSRDELEMVDLIHPCVDAFEGVHRRRNVASDRHAEAVCFYTDGFDDVGFEQGVELDLFEAGGVVSVDYCGGFFGLVNADCTKCGGSGSVDESGEEQARAKGVLGVDCLPDCGEELKLAAAVASGGDSGGKEGSAKLYA